MNEHEYSGLGADRETCTISWSNLLANHRVWQCNLYMHRNENAFFFVTWNNKEMLTFVFLFPEISDQRDHQTIVHNTETLRITIGFCLCQVRASLLEGIRFITELIILDSLFTLSTLSIYEMYRAKRHYVHLKKKNFDLLTHTLHDAIYYTQIICIWDHHYSIMKIQSLWWS